MEWIRIGVSRQTRLTGRLDWTDKRRGSHVIWGCLSLQYPGLWLVLKSAFEGALPTSRLQPRLSKSWPLFPRGMSEGISS